MRGVTEWKQAPFTCPVCGVTKMLPVVNNRIRCPECSTKHWHENARQWAKKSPSKPKMPPKVETPAPQPKKPALSPLDEQIMLQRKLQCEKCAWWRNNGTKTDCCCVYYLVHGVGHRVDHGNGPGDCRMYKPKGKATEEERLRIARMQISLMEAERGTK